ncbi:MAG: ankyrin repeat domain-containing protein [Planctomycetes bacterium]|nr:ankyrin repeat domain-containing protein [Planctomycetota bacterium]
MEDPAMTYDRLFTPDEFRLVAGVDASWDIPNVERLQGRYESVQLCNGKWRNASVPRGRYGRLVSRPYETNFLTTRFVYASRVLAEAYAETRHRYPDWLAHRSIPDRQGFHRIEFTSPSRADAERFCWQAVQEIASSRRIEVAEQVEIGPDEHVSEFGTSRLLRQVLIVVDAPQIERELVDELHHRVQRGERWMPETSPRSFEFAEIEPHLVPLDARLLALRNIQEAQLRLSPQDEELFTAVEHLDLDRAVALIAAGANVNALRDGETPLNSLTDASRLDFKPSAPSETAPAEISQPERIELLGRLLRLGADIDLFGLDGISPLATAVLKQEGEVVEFLLAQGADPNRNNYPLEHPERNSTPLDYASADYDLSERGSEEECNLARIREALKRAGAVIERSD